MRCNDEGCMQLRLNLKCRELLNLPTLTWKRVHFFVDLFANSAVKCLYLNEQLQI